MFNKKGQQNGILSPMMIMAIVVSLICLVVGVYALFTTLYQIPTNNDTKIIGAIQNVTTTSNQVVNILGVVLILGTIMLIVGMIYSFMNPPSSNLL